MSNNKLKSVGDFVIVSFDNSKKRILEGDEAHERAKEIIDSRQGEEDADRRER